MCNIIIFSSFVEIICDTKNKLLSNIKFTGLVFSYVSLLYMNIYIKWPTGRGQLIVVFNLLIG